MLNFQGQSLTPLSQTIQQSRRGFDSLLGVVRDEIQTKRKADELKMNVEAQKDMLRFQSDEQLRAAQEGLDFELHRLDKITDIQTEAEVDSKTRIYNATTGPQQRAQEQARAQAQAVERNLELTQGVNEYFYVDNSDLMDINGIARPVNSFIDPETGLQMVTVVNRVLGSNGETQQVVDEWLYVDFQTYVSGFNAVRDFLNTYRENIDSLAREDEEIGSNDEMLSVQRIGRTTAAEIVSQIRSGGPQAQRYMEQIANGDIELNIIENPTLATEQGRRESNVNAAYGSFIANYGRLFNSGEYSILRNNKGFWNAGWRTYRFDINSQSIGQLNQEFQRMFTYSNINSPEELQKEDNQLFNVYQTMQSLITEYTRVNPQSARNMDNLYFNPNVSSPNIHEIFQYRAPVSENTDGTNIIDRQSAAAAAQTTTILNFN